MPAISILLLSLVHEEPIKKKKKVNKKRGIRKSNGEKQKREKEKKERAEERGRKKPSGRRRRFRNTLHGGGARKIEGMMSGRRPIIANINETSSPALSRTRGTGGVGGNGATITSGAEVIGEAGRLDGDPGGRERGDGVFLEDGRTDQRIRQMSFFPGHEHQRLEATRASVFGPTIKDRLVGLVFDRRRGRKLLDGLV
jgi:hypothetical protein